MNNFKIKKSYILILFMYIIIFLLYTNLKSKNDIEFFNTITEDNAFQTVKFGRLVLSDEQIGNKEEIEWYILDESDGKYLLVTKDTILTFVFHNNYKNLSWENSLIRYYLNNQFYKNSFYESEKAEIFRTDIINNKPNIFGKNFGNNTYDDVFILNIEEINYYFKDNYHRISHYKKENEENDEVDYFNVYYWTRDRGFNDTDVATVNSDGSINYYGYDIFTTDIYIRPSIWVNKEYFDKKG